MIVGFFSYKKSFNALLYAAIMVRNRSVRIREFTIQKESFESSESTDFYQSIERNSFVLTNESMNCLWNTETDN